MLKFLLVTLCIYFFFRIIFRSFSTNIRSATNNRTNESSQGKKPPDSVDEGSITIEHVQKKDSGTDYTDFEEIK